MDANEKGTGPGRFAVAATLATIFLTVFAGQVLPAFQVHVEARAQNGTLTELLNASLGSMDKIQVDEVSTKVGMFDLTVKNIVCSSPTFDSSLIGPVNEVVMRVDVLKLNLSNCSASFDARKSIAHTSGQVHGTLGGDLHLHLNMSHDEKGQVEVTVVHCSADLHPDLHFEGGLVAYGAEKMREKANAKIAEYLPKPLCTQLPELMKLKAIEDHGLMMDPASTPEQTDVPTNFLTNTAAFSVWEGVTKLFSIEEYALALLIACFSGVWPYIKLMTIGFVWYGDLSRKASRNILFWVHLLGKWSMLDVIFVVILLVVLQSAFSLNMIASDIVVSPLIGAYVYCLAILSSITMTSVLSFKLSEHLSTGRSEPADFCSGGQKMKKPRPLVKDSGFPADYDSDDSADSWDERDQQLEAEEQAARTLGSRARCCLAVLVENPLTHAVLFLLLVSGLCLPCFRVTKEINVALLGQDMQDHREYNYSLLGAIYDTMFVAQPSNALCWIIGFFVVFVPVIKWAVVFFLWCFTCDPAKRQLRLHVWMDTMHAFDLRDVYLATLGVMLLRVHQMVDSMSAHYANMDVIVGDSPGVYLCAASVVAETFLLFYSMYGAKSPSM